MKVLTFSFLRTPDIVYCVLFLELSGLFLTRCGFLFLSFLIPRAPEVFPGCTLGRVRDCVFLFFYDRGFRLIRLLCERHSIFPFQIFPSSSAKPFLPRFSPLERKISVSSSPEFWSERENVRSLYFRVHHLRTLEHFAPQKAFFVTLCAHSLRMHLLEKS